MGKIARVSGQPYTHLVATAAALLALDAAYDIHEGDRALQLDNGTLYERLQDGTNAAATSGWRAIGTIDYQAVETLTWAAAHDVKDLTLVLPSVGCVIEVYAKASTGTPHIDIGNKGSGAADTDWYMDDATLGTGWKKLALTNPIPDPSKTGNLNLTVEVSADGGWDDDASENFTGSVSLLVCYRRVLLS